MFSFTDNLSTPSRRSVAKMGDICEEHCVTENVSHSPSNCCVLILPLCRRCCCKVAAVFWGYPRAVVLWEAVGPGSADQRSTTGTCILEPVISWVTWVILTHFLELQSLTVDVYGCELQELGHNDFNRLKREWRQCCSGSLMLTPHS